MGGTEANSGTESREKQEGERIESMRRISIKSSRPLFEQLNLAV